ncbi:hypothetical protein DPX16_8863 [Anabarilius grahami]|uniref:Uncharacterized protein n=1 Tax=Anabarilius grahami TaxID=495550 RepID=A0A3N0YF38_ANAGA|nr:hypothetical protein DPX16_8863 [Anabarilius grahami]
MKAASHRPRALVNTTSIYCLSEENACLTAPDSPLEQKGKWRPDTKSIAKAQRYLSVLSGDLFVYTLNEGGRKCEDGEENRTKDTG